MPSREIVLGFRGQQGSWGSLKKCKPDSWKQNFLWARYDRDRPDIAIKTRNTHPLGTNLINHLLRSHELRIIGFLPRIYLRPSFALIS